MYDVDQKQNQVCEQSEWQLIVANYNVVSPLRRNSVLEELRVSSRPGRDLL